jgi:predicted dehydrogenase
VRLFEGNFAYPVPRAGNGRLFDIDRGGGALLDRGVYVISLTNYLLGKPDSIQGSTALGPTGVDEQSSYELLFADGTIAALTASFLVRGTNEFVISGEYGSIRICEPFFCAHRWEERSYARQAPSQTASIQTQGARPRFAQRLIKRPTVKLLRRQLDPLLRVLDRKKIHNLPFAGNGYQFEVMEVNRCLRDKRTESDIMSLDDSLEVLRLMDALRSQWGLVYPQECLELKSLR